MLDVIEYCKYYCDKCKKIINIEEKESKIKLIHNKCGQNIIKIQDTYKTQIKLELITNENQRIECNADLIY